MNTLPTCEGSQADLPGSMIGCDTKTRTIVAQLSRKAMRRYPTGFGIQRSSQSALNIASTLAQPDSTARLTAIAALIRSLRAAIDDGGDHDRNERKNGNEVPALYAPDCVCIARREDKIRNQVDDEDVRKRRDGGHDRDPIAVSGRERKRREEGAREQHADRRVDPGEQARCQTGREPRSVAAKARRRRTRARRRRRLRESAMDDRSDGQASRTDRRRPVLAR